MHVTGNSSVVLDALQAGKPSIVIDHYGVEYYADLIAAGKVSDASDPVQLRQALQSAISRAPAPPRRQPDHLVPGVPRFLSEERLIMPGLFGCVLLNMKARCRPSGGHHGGCLFLSSFTATCGSKTGCILQGVEVRRWRRDVPGPTPHYARNGDIRISVDGWILSVDGTRCSSPADSASLLIRSYQEKGHRFIDGVEGEFNLFLLDEKRNLSILANDRFGLRPCFYSYNEEVFCFGFEGKQIVRALERRPELDLGYAWNYLSFGRAVLGDHTFYKQVRTLGPASLVLIEKGKVAIQRYWRIQYRPTEIDADFYENLAGVFRRAVEKRIFPGVRYGLTLSGGLDSRVVAQVLSDKTSNSALAITFGNLESDEVRYAVSVADRLAMQKRIIELFPGDFIDNARLGSKFSEAHDLFVQSYGLKVFSAVKNNVDISHYRARARSHTGRFLY